jgi:hypothetical protein
VHQDGIGPLRKDEMMTPSETTTYHMLLAMAEQALESDNSDFVVSEACNE